MIPRAIPDTMSMAEVLSDLPILLPEAIIICSILAVLVFDLFQTPEKSYRSAILGLIGCGLALFAVISALTTQFTVDGQFQAAKALYCFREMIVVDPLALLFKGLFITATFTTILMFIRFRPLRGLRHGEYVMLLLTALLGMCLLASSRDLIMFILALETLSLPSYILAAFLRDDRASTEAGIKYLLYGAVATGVMLFGFSYIYGLSGSTRLDFLSTVPFSLTLGISLILVIAGLAFKISAAPFHFWAPDVYHGAPTPITAWLSVASKAAGFAALLRLMQPLFAGGELQGLADSLQLSTLFGILAILTMTLGNTVAIWQTNVKRLLAYSSIAHAGYLVMGLAVMTPEAVNAIILYLLIYFLMNFGAFLITMYIENQHGNSELDSFKGMWKRNPLLMVAMTFCLLSLTGIPPFAGFIAKLNLFAVLIKEHYITLALIGVANSVVSAWYYLKIVKTMVFYEPEEGIGLFRLSWFDAAFVIVLVAPILYLGIFWNSLYQFVGSVIQGVGG